MADYYISSLLRYHYPKYKGSVSSGRSKLRCNFAAFLDFCRHEGYRCCLRDKFGRFWKQCYRSKQNPVPQFFCCQPLLPGRSFLFNPVPQLLSSFLARKYGIHSNDQYQPNVIYFFHHPHCHPYDNEKGPCISGAIKYSELN